MRWGWRCQAAHLPAQHCTCPGTRRRTLAPESWLRDCLAATTRRLRAALPPEQRAEAERRDARDAQSMADSARQPAAGEAEALPARTTGDAAWLAARGEDGSAVTKQQQQGAAVPPPGTRYRLAKDEGLAAAQPGRLCGGAVRASGENGPSERATSAFDGSPHTKWLEFGGPRGNAWLEYRLPAEQPAVVLASYALTAANDSPERDPRHTVLEAWWEGERALSAGLLVAAWHLASCLLQVLSTRPSSPLFLQRRAAGWQSTSSTSCASRSATSGSTSAAPRRPGCLPLGASACGW